MTPTEKIHSGRFYICRECVPKHGGEYPECHIATHHMGECAFCGEQKSLAHTSDYDWPRLKGLLPSREV